MFDKIKNKVNQMILDAEERKKENERLEREKLEKEKERLLALSEKELLVELILIMKDVVKEEKDLSERVEQLDGEIYNLKYNNEQ